MRRLLLDENLSKSTIALCQSLGFNIKSVIEEGAGLPDEVIINIAQKERRIVITLDKDFGNLMKFPLRYHYGIILLRLKNESPRLVNKRLREILFYLKTKHLKNTLIIASENRMRILKP